MGLLLSNLYQIYVILKKYSPDYNPLVSIIIPAFNEEKMIASCVTSALTQKYSNRQIIVINDGSTDNTLQILKNLTNEFKRSRLLRNSFSSIIQIDERFIVINQENQGKSVALNNGIAHAKGELITVLDADSELDECFLNNMVKYFVNPKTTAIAANVRIRGAHNFIELVQMIEYMLSYQLKVSEQVLNLEYIIGGIGSTFRKSALEKVNYYSTNTITEDIDLTMKLLKEFGNKLYGFGYAFDCLVYTPAVHNFNQLVKQRYRWKFGRFKALFSYSSLMFNLERSKFSPTLSWWKLPKVFIEELFLILDPFILVWMYLTILNYQDYWALYTIFGLYFIFAINSISNHNYISSYKKMVIASAQFTYFLLYMINVVDYICLIKCIFHFKELTLKDGQAKWTHVDR